MRWFLALSVLWVGGCKKAVDAPDSLEEIMVFGFVHMDDPASIEQVVADLPALVAQNQEQLGFGYRVDSLTAADVQAAGVDSEFEDIIGGLGAFDYRNDLDPVLDAVSHPDKDELFENTLEYTVQDDGTRDCFLAQECDSYRFTATQVSKQPFLGEVTQSFDQHFVWVDHEDGPRIACRVLAEDPVDISSGLAAIDRQFSFFVLLPKDGGGVERVEAMWAEARLLGIDIPDGNLIDMLVGAMGEQADRVDDWIEGVTD